MDKKKAAEMYQLAADQGDLTSICNIGFCYETGSAPHPHTRTHPTYLYLQ